MRFGLLWPLRNPEPWRRPLPELYRDTLDEIVAAEALGYDDAWLTEHHFSPDDYLPTVMPALAAAAARTTRIRLGPYVLLGPLHHPLRLAEDAAVVDVLSNGRLDLGIGVGYRPEEFAGLGIEQRRRGTLHGEGVEVMLAAWREGPIDHTGRHWRFTGVDVTPKPVQRPIPIYLGGTSLPVLRRAARLGVPGIAGRPARQDMEAFAAACAEYGRTPADFEYLPMRYVWVASTSQKARRVALPFTEYVLGMYDRWFASAGDQAFSRPIEEVAIIGSPAEVTERLGDFLTRRPDVPVHRMVIQPPLLGLDHAASMEMIELFAGEVMPALGHQPATAVSPPSTA
jgi:alkanesulfonate monooxygenase SsuD/methylene tetrahydromethanopterin reductase-like flavin-dependent oxidoreductase (luciferase family)